uniref:Extended synaptotagmin 2 n=1 Tax=Sander lucioperca TaxID=283035 RepID=A0A8D0D3A7_SANLU
MTDIRGAQLPKENNGHIAPSPAQPSANFPHPSVGNIPDDIPVSSTSELTQTWVHVAKTFVLIFPIYALGYFEFSFSWLLIGLVIFFWWRRITGGKNSRLSRALAFFEQEERSIKQGLTTSDLPPWVHFPDVERVEWLNKTVKQMWPYICQLVEKLFHETIEPAVKESNAHLSTFCFSKIDMGEKVSTSYSDNTDYWQQCYDQFKVIDTFLLNLYVLLSLFSLLFFQLLDITWTGLTNILDIPGLSGFSDSLIQDIIYSYLVLPNRITIPLVGDVELARLRFPMPKGVLRIHFLEAQDLEGKDTFLGGLIKGKSDPYGVLQIGNQLFQSKVVKESLHPKWNEVYEALVYEHSEAPTGKLHLKLEWLSLLSTPEKLDQVLRSVRADRSLANDGLSSALLVVHLDSAKNLPCAKKSSSEPSSYVQFTVGHKTLESKIRYKNKEPLWEECFSFFVHNPRRQELELEVKDDKHKCTLGNLTVPLSGLLEEKDMTLTQCFPLKNSGPSSTIKLKMALRVSSDQPSSIQVRKSSVPQPTPAPTQRRSASDSPLPPPTPPPPIDASTLTLQHRDGEPYSASPLRSFSNLSTCMSSSQKHLPHKESTPSLASDISLPFATLELQQRLRQLQNGSAPSQYPLGEIQLTVRHSSQRNKLIVVVHACRNLIAFTKDSSDPFIRLCLLPDKSRTGRRKTSTMKRNLNPVYDQTFEFSVSMVELHRRTLDVAVKNGGSILSKHRGLLGKVLVDLSGADISKGWTQWYDLSEDGVSCQGIRSIQDSLLTQ